MSWASLGDFWWLFHSLFEYPYSIDSKWTEWTLTLIWLVCPLPIHYQLTTNNFLSFVPVTECCGICIQYIYTSGRHADDCSSCYAYSNRTSSHLAMGCGQHHDYSLNNPTTNHLSLPAWRVFILNTAVTTLCTFSIPICIDVKMGTAAMISFEYYAY